MSRDNDLRSYWYFGYTMIAVIFYLTKSEVKWVPGKEN